MKRTIYLKSTPLEEALRLWQERLSREGLDRPLPSELAEVIDSLGRITAEAVVANVSSPFYHSSAMDGYAVRFADTFGASETNPVRLRVPGQAVAVDTGDPMPEGFNGVIMIEDVNIIREQKTALAASSTVAPEGTADRSGRHGDFIEITEPVTPWQNVRTIGEDIVATELIVPENHRIRPVDIGALLAGGHTDIPVRKRPIVAIIPTGNEIVEPGSALLRGNIIEYNSRVLGGLATELGADPLRYPIVRDDPDALGEVISSACKAADLVVINAGSSAGSEDFTAQAISQAGEVLVHGVGIKPGKPIILGIVGRKPVFGIPGYPVSAYITFNLFVKPLLCAWQGLAVKEPERIKARLSRQVASPLGQEEFVRVKVGLVAGKTIATPVSRGAGVIMSLVRADGIVRIPSLSEGLGAGAETDVELLRPMQDIRNTIVCIGSHDNALDVLANFLKKRYPEYSLASAHVGSMGGLIALKKGEAHIAGTHLLDEEMGLYNVPFIERLLPDRHVVLLNLVYRQQGLLVRKGNPKNIRGYADLDRKDVAFINRQSGSGTRLLTDKHLRELGIEPSRIRGYDREEYTHMGVASAVLSGVADTGLAILAAAHALDLDFIPVARERYDIAVMRDLMDEDMIRALIDVIRNDGEFKRTVENMGGYDIVDMGKVMYER